MKTLNIHDRWLHLSFYWEKLKVNSLFQRNKKLQIFNFPGQLHIIITMVPNVELNIKQPSLKLIIGEGWSAN